VNSPDRLSLLWMANQLALQAIWTRVAPVLPARLA
jgi:hypothetical protein